MTVKPLPLQRFAESEDTPIQQVSTDLPINGGHHLIRPPRAPRFPRPAADVTKLWPS
ncbi:hypothetical protein K2D_15700 [Planctomycetes bacterium K2D]|uniref:Uncharacterized protein n=1 Tax=Botrimarina mediterranea TaxID=2528022 RepID=A0A518K6N5_9BACT|nr:hypothetical protein Spa11_16440 [Botrimarina mediterranea]QDV77965.1 hypothetical protein K2D_15700 [Planctomycetes bacterium K2D]